MKKVIRVIFIVCVVAVFLTVAVYVVKPKHRSDLEGWKNGLYYSAEFIPKYEPNEKNYIDARFYCLDDRLGLYIFFGTFENAYCLELTFDEEAYAAEKERINQTITFESQSVIRSGKYYDLPSNEFVLGAYDVRVVKNKHNIYYTKDLKLIACSDEQNKIRYCQFFDESLDYFSNEANFYDKIKTSLGIKW